MYINFNIYKRPDMGSI